MVATVPPYARTSALPTMYRGSSASDALTHRSRLLWPEHPVASAWMSASGVSVPNTTRPLLSAVPPPQPRGLPLPQWAVSRTFAKAPHARVAIDPHHEDVAVRRRCRQIGDVAAVQQIEHPVGEHHLYGPPSPFLGAACPTTRPGYEWPCLWSCQLALGATSSALPFLKPAASRNR